MAWWLVSFTYTDPSASDLEHVRFIIGDTDSADPQFVDAEITFLLTQKGSVLGAAVGACDALISKFSRKVTTTSNLGQTVSWSDLAKHYRDLRVDLLRQIPVAPYAGGISAADKLSEEEDTDRPAPAFSVGMHDYE